MEHITKNLEYPIKTKDLSARLGISERQIQRHIANHQEELADHVIRKGAKGTWLDETAVEMILQNMRDPAPSQAIIVAEASVMEENRKLKEEIDRAKDRIIALQEQKIEIQEITMKLQASEHERQEREREAADRKARIEELEESLKQEAEKLREANTIIDAMKKRNIIQRIFRIGEKDK